MKRRLFITTGNYSLLNCLAIISAQKGGEFSDDLFILSFQFTEEFRKANLEMATLHTFEHITFASSIPQDFERIFADYDVVYQVVFTGLIDKLLKNREALSDKFILFNESSSFAAWSPAIFKNAKYLYINNFIDKFSFPHSNIRYIDKNALRELCARTSRKNNLEIELPAGEKSVLLIGNYLFYSLLGVSKTLRYYEDIIRTFSENGFTVYFHPHPRELTQDIHRFSSAMEVFGAKTVHSFFPLEAFRAPFSCVAGSFSNLLLTFPYLENIPAIHFKLPEIYERCQDLTLLKALCVVETYTPDISEFKSALSLDCQSFNEQARRIYRKWIKRKFPWRFNPRLRAIAAAKTLDSFNFFRKYL